MVNKEAYSPYKYVHYKEELKKIAKKKIVSPVSIQIDLTNKCDNKCRWCFWDTFNPDEFSRKDVLSKSVVTSVIDDFKKLGGKSIEWTGGGEPTIHKDYIDIVDHAKNLNLNQALVTNGKTLTDMVSDRARDFAWVRVSLNAGTKNSYKRIHKTDSFERVVKNVGEFAKTKNPKCVFGISMMVDEINYFEMSLLTKIAKDLGVDNVRFGILQSPDNEKRYLPIWDTILNEMDKALSLEGDGFNVFTFSNRLDVIQKKTKSVRCYHHHLTPSLGANGGLYPCCYLKYTKQGNLGNVNDSSLIDVWFGEKRLKFINTIGEDCRESCWMNDKNNLADYIIKNPQELNHLDYP